MTLPGPVRFKYSLNMEYKWLKHFVLTEQIDESVSVTWSAYNASMKRSKKFEIIILSLLPLLRDRAHSVATIKHAMNKIKHCHISESRTDSCNSSLSATLCHCQTNTMELARYLWRGEVYYYV